LSKLRERIGPARLRVYSRDIGFSLTGIVFDIFSRHTSNPWIEKDRQDQRKVILTVVAITGVVATGIGLLVYALTQG
jgi:hypothetical protein